MILKPECHPVSTQTIMSSWQLLLVWVHAVEMRFRGLPQSTVGRISATNCDVGGGKVKLNCLLTLAQTLDKTVHHCPQDASAIL